MAKKFKNIEELFRINLVSHQVPPSARAWERLESQLDQKNKPGWAIWGRWAAAILLMGGVSYFLWQYQAGISPENIEIADNYQTTQPAAAPDPEELVGIGDNIEEAKAPVQRKSRNAPSGNYPAQSSLKNQSLEKPKARQEESPITDTTKHLSVEMPLAENFSESWQDPIDIILPPLDTADLTAENADGTEVEYTVRIVSRGYAISPDKENIVDEIENKVGGFFNKVDQGFADIQDAKNNLVASLTSRKERNKK
jgi:hypothetical protein